MLWTRRVFTMTGFAVAAAAFCVLAHTRDEVAATALIAIIACAHTLHSSGYVANYVEVAGAADVGVLSSVGNTLANISGFVGPPFVAHLLAVSNGSWAPIFYSTAALYATQVSLYGGFSSVEMQQRKTETKAKAG